MTQARKIAVIGLGYVGLPVAVSFARHHAVVGYDLDPGRIDQLKQAYDRTNELSEQELLDVKLQYTSEPAAISDSDFYIVTVPTPVDEDKQPQLDMVHSASKVVGAALNKGDIVVYESTVYPGTTEEECMPLLEAASGLQGGKDFFVGYSPERINPGDREHSFSSITKIVSAQDDATLTIIADTYAQVVDADIYRAPSIKVAEAAKAIENTQRDLNIALMNELAIIFDKLEVDTADVIEAASTKWNFIPFKPGLVGGHCIGVDPYYLTYKSKQAGYIPEVILAGRDINDAMGKFIAAKLIKALFKTGCAGEGCVVTLMGFTFKENVPDIRNTAVTGIVKELLEHNATVQIHDPLADKAEARGEYEMQILDYEDLLPADAVILAVAHEEYVQGGWKLMKRTLNDESGIVFDVKGILDRDARPGSIELLRL